MKLAYTMAQTAGDLDLVLFRLANDLAAKGWKTAGVVQINTERETCHPCDMDVQILPDGPSIRISQSLGREAKGCRLDPAALEKAVAAVTQRLAGEVDVLIVNKFGKHEADGRGFRDVIAEALSLNIPVITGVNGINEKAFLAFSGGMAQQVTADVSDLVAWLGAAEVPSEVA